MREDRQQTALPSNALPLRAALRVGMSLAFVFSAFSAVPAQPSQTLSQVDKIYVMPLGHGKVGEEVRKRVISRLRKKGSFEVVQVPDKADAVLSGQAEVWVTGYESASPRSPATSRLAIYSGFLSARITGKGNEVLWSYLVTPGKFAWAGIVNDLADKLAAKLLEARSEPSEVAAERRTNRSPVIALHGAGATFPAPLYQKWFQTIEAEQHDERIAYDAVGSETGIALLSEGKVDFAASDMPLTDERMARSGVAVQHFPSVLGAVVPIYNVAGIARPLNFTPEVLAEIYLGKIRRWNDPKITAVNRGLTLPDTEIVVVHRSDGSGTTFVWSDFLSKSSAEWKSAIGSGTQLTWPVGTGAERNEGVAVRVQRTANAIGYVELAFALQHRVSFGAVQNAAGVFVRADLSSVRAAAASGAESMSADFRVSITNAPGSDAYPIASFTWILLPKEISDPARKAAMYQLVDWILTSGQKQCSELGYTPLPREIVTRELALLHGQQ